MPKNEPPHQNIVCLADSIGCEWDEPRFPTFWQQLLDKTFGKGTAKVIAAGVYGETAQDGYYRVHRDVISHRPDLVTIMFGHNDVLQQKIDPYVYQQYLAKTINIIHQYSSTDIWLLSPNKVDNQQVQKQYRPYLSTLKPLAKEKSIEFVDVWNNAFVDQDLNKIYTYEFDTPGLSGRDYVHPNDKGQKLIAQYLMDQLQKT